MYAFLNREINEKYSKNDLIRNYEKILIVLMPILPHFSNECLEMITKSKKFIWPKIDEKYLIEKEANIVVQINGKKRQLIRTIKDISEDDLLDTIMKDEILSKYLKNLKIKKKIYIANKLINIII